MKTFKSVLPMCFIVLSLVAVGGLLGGCTSNDPIDKYQAIFEKENPKWEVFEVKEEAVGTVIRVEVSDPVSFKDSKKVLAVIQKAYPKLAGYIEFYNSEVGMVLRKVEIIPVTT